MSARLWPAYLIRLTNALQLCPIWTCNNVQKCFATLSKKGLQKTPEIIDRCYNKGKKIGVYTIEESAYMDMGQLEELEKMKMKLNVNTN